MQASLLFYFQSQKQGRSFESVAQFWSGVVLLLYAAEQRESLAYTDSIVLHCCYLAYAATLKET